MSNLVRWLVRTIKSLLSSATITKEIVTRNGTDITFLRADLNETPPTKIELNQHSVTLTNVASTTAFLALQNDSGTDLPIDFTGHTIEAYKNTTLNQVLIFGIGNVTTPKAVYRAELTADKI